jgi:4-oxalocrotonate tautomerase
MPTIQIDFLEGRTLEQRRAMVKKVTEAMVESIGCKPEAVQIIIREMSRQHLSRNGKLRCDE